MCRKRIGIVVKRFRGVVEYDGSGFSGSQWQAGGQVTVQGALESAIKRVTGEELRVLLSSRTDTGVHAEGQVMAFTLQTDRDPGLLIKSLNGVLNKEVSVQRLGEAPEGFSPRHDAESKIYRYRIRHGMPRSPLFRGRVLDLERSINGKLMQGAVACIEGNHEFRLFVTLNKAEKKKTRLDIDRAWIVEHDHLHELFFKGKGFLRKMVRRLVGSIIEVGYGKLSLADLKDALEGKEPLGFKCLTAAAEGLTLVRVWYPDGWPSEDE
jgi:tRNA pseudouridine38-40 synthase